MAFVSKFVDLDGSSYDLKAVRTAAIPFGRVDGTSTSTNFTASVEGITELYDGVCCYLMNGAVTSAANWTLNVNGLGAKPVYSTLAAETRTTTIFNVSYTMLFVYNSTRIEGGCWDIFYGYDSNTNTIGYQVRTNSSTRPVSDQCGRYRLLFSSADDTKWVPANTSNSTNATSSRTVNQRPIDPFGEIRYYSYTTVYAADATVGTGYQWSQNVFNLGYSFNRTGAALTLTYPAPVYIKCAPQSDGSAVIDADTPYVQALPSTADGKIYIYLGKAYSATNVELVEHHPVYEYKDGQVRLYTNSAASITIDSALNSTSENPVQNKIITNELSTKQDALTFDLIPVYGSNNVVESGGIYNAIEVAAKKAGIVIDAGYITDYGISGGDLIIGENILFNGPNCSLYNEINTEFSIGYKNISIRLKKDGPESLTGSGLPSDIDHSDGDIIYREADEYLMRFENVTSSGYYIFYTFLNGLNNNSKSDSGTLYAVLYVSSNRITLTIKTIPLGIQHISFSYNSELNKYELNTTLEDAIWILLTYGPIRVNLIDNSTPRLARYFRITKADFSSGLFAAENINEYNMLSLFTLQVTNPDFTQNQYVITITHKALAGTSDIPTATSDLTNDSGFITDAGVTSVNGSTGAVTGIQTTSNLVTSVTSSSTDSEYPSAKLFYDTIGNVESLLAAI